MVFFILSSTFNIALKKASIQPCIPIHCLPHIQQLVENFAGKIAKMTEYHLTVKPSDMLNELFLGL